MSEAKEERRRKEKEDARKRSEEIDKLLEEPRHPPFEAPASGTVVEDPKLPGRR